MTELWELLTSKARAEILRVLFGKSDAALYVRELERQTGYAVGTLQYELKKLERLELVKKTRDGNRLYYRANPDHPLYPDIKNIVSKTAGRVAILRDALGKSSRIQIAFIFGSFAENRANAKSDVDLMIIGDIGLRQVTELLSGVSLQIGREINPCVMTPEEYRSRRDEKEHFVSAVSASPRVFVKGTEDGLERVGR